MSDRESKAPAGRRPGTIGTSDRFKDAAGQIWKLTRKGWRNASKGKPNGKRA